MLYLNFVPEFYIISESATNASGMPCNLFFWAYHSLSEGSRVNRLPVSSFKIDVLAVEHTSQQFQSREAPDVVATRLKLTAKWTLSHSKAVLPYISSCQYSQRSQCQSPHWWGKYLISASNEPLHCYHRLSPQSNPFQTAASCGLLLHYNFSCCNAFLQHAVFEVRCAGITLEWCRCRCIRDRWLVLAWVTGCRVVWEAKWAKSLTWFRSERRI